MKTRSFLFLVIAFFAMVSCSIDKKERYLPIEGLDGKNSLVRVTEVTTTPNCDAGGVKLEFGLDQDGNGMLEDVEITSTAYVCNGLDGADGADGKDAVASLIDVQPVNAGSSCLSGGVVVYTGWDLNGNGVLDEDERANEQLVCNGVAGTNTLIKTEEIASGSNECAEGGFYFYSGPDNNSNGVLDENEIEYSRPICNGEDGLSIALRIAHDEETSCENGGAKLYFGLDQNSNGKLDTGEEIDFVEICHGQDGEDGQDGYNAAQRTKIIPTSPTHPNGGYQLQSGLDTNRDGVLNDNEVTSSISIFHGSNGADGLNGENGYNSLTGSELVPPSPTHPYGGHFFYSGLDINRNGSLDPSERTSTTFISNGINGTNGTNGSNGQDGYNTLVEILPDVPSVGDKTIQTGLDKNRNGLLDPSEIENTFVVSDGADGYNSLTKVVPVAPTSAHPKGGYLLQSGLDKNRNNVLDNSEITSSVFVSHGKDGEDGLNSLTRTVPVAATPAYPNGGYNLLMGLDSNQNGYLDNSEVSSSVFISNGQDGAAGYTALVEVLEDNPSTGKNTIKIGLDINGNGTLEASEVTKTFVIEDGSDGSNGQNGSNGYTSLINVLTGTPNPGHTTIQIGLDINGNGVLDASEITQTFVVENGEDGEDGVCPECECTEIYVEIEEPGINCEFGGLKIITKKGDTEEINYLCNGGGCYDIAAGEFVIDFTDGDGPNNKPLQVNTYMPKHLYPQDGCEGYIITGAYYTGCTSEKSGKIRDGGSSYGNVLELYNSAGGALFFDFAKYNTISNGNNNMGKASVISFELNPKSGTSFSVEGVDIDGNVFSKQVTLSGSGFQTVDLGWSNITKFYIIGNAKFQIDNLHLACGNVVNTCD